MKAFDPYADLEKGPDGVFVKTPPSGTKTGAGGTPTPVRRTTTAAKSNNNGGGILSWLWPGNWFGSNASTAPSLSTVDDGQAG